MFPLGTTIPALSNIAEEGSKLAKDRCKRCGKCCYLRVGGFGVIVDTNKRCEHLTDNNLCAVYDNRPPWCLTAKQMIDLDALPQSCGYRGGV